MPRATMKPRVIGSSVDEPEKHRIHTTSVACVYPHDVTKAEKKDAHEPKSLIDEVAKGKLVVAKAAGFGPEDEAHAPSTGQGVALLGQAPRRPGLGAGPP